MAENIFKLIGSVFVDTEEANNSLQKTDQKAQSVGDTFGNLASGAAKVGTAVVAGATAAVTGIVNLANNTAAAADEVDKASIRMGVSAEAYQELAYAAGQCGVETSVLEMAAKKLEGTDINMEEAMEQIMAMSTAEEKATKAAELFGNKVAYQMSPLIEQSTESYEGLIDRANELGLVMSQDAVTAGVVLGDTMSDVSQAFDKLVIGLGSAVVPIVQNFADMIIEYLPWFQELFTKLSPIIQDVFEKLVPPLMELCDVLLPVVFDLAESLIGPLSEMAVQILPIVTDLMAMLGPALADLASAALPVIVNLLNAALPILQPILQLLQPILQVAIALLDPLMKLIDIVITPMIKLLSEGLTKALNGIQPILKKVADWFTNAFDDIGGGLERVGKFFTDLWEGIKAGMKAALNTMIGFLNGLISGINLIYYPLRKVIQAVGNVFGAKWSMDQIAIPSIPYLAKGGQITGEGAAIVGEAGAELISMPKGATVTPLTNNGDVLPGISDLNDKIDKLIDIVANVSNMGVYINGSALVGKIAPEMDKTLGRMATRSARGIA